MSCIAMPNNRGWYDEKKFTVKCITANRREQLRRQAYEAFRSGITGHAFAKQHQIYAETVYSWYRRFSVCGEDVIKERKRGPEKNAGALLNSRQMKKLQKTVIGTTPDQLKFPFALWSSKALQTCIEKTWHVKPCRRSVGRYMNKMNFTCQCPKSAIPAICFSCFTRRQ